MLSSQLENREKRYLELEKLLTDPQVISDREKFQKYAKELSEIKELVGKYRQYKKIGKELEETKSLLAEKELKELAQRELEKLEKEKKKLEEEIEVLLLPKDPLDEKNIILEIRAGTGGNEAALFAGDLLRMYLRYAERQGWKTETISSNPTGLGGYKEAIVNILGKGVYSKLKYEGGTHRVQRVPVTEAGGRIHTSATTVAILPEPQEVEVKIEDKDLRIDTFRSSGPGGQHMQKTSSAVRITHLPSSLVVSCEDERSQHQNKAKALKLLRAKLFALAQEDEQEKRAAARRIMVGSGDRSEKIRTYNFPQSRVTDHRIGLTLYRLQEILDGDLEEIIQGLSSADRAAKLK